MGSPVELEASAVELKTIVAKTFALLVIVRTATLDPVTLKKIQLMLFAYKEQITNADTIITLDLAEIKEQLEKILNAPLKTLTEHLKESRPDDASIATTNEKELTVGLKIAEDAPLKALQAIQQEYAKEKGNLSVNNIFNLRQSLIPQPKLDPSSPAPRTKENNVVVPLNQTVLSEIIKQELKKITQQLARKNSSAFLNNIKTPPSLLENNIRLFPYPPQAQQPPSDPATAPLTPGSDG